MDKKHVALSTLIFLLVFPVVLHIVLWAAPGFASFIVVSGSMEPTITRGSIVYVQEQDSYSPGDVITFYHGEEIITHRTVARVEDEYITRGDANEDADDWRISESQIIGEVLFFVPLYGFLLKMANTPIGYVITIFIPGLSLIGLETYRFIGKIRQQQ